MKNITDQDGQSADIINDNVEQLKTLFPDAFTENGIKFDVLRQLLGDAKVLDEGEEKYGLNWHGKKKARQIALTPSMGTLRPCPEESVDWDTTKNLFIEGDNLEVLKLLQKSYAGKVKMIYIDPPYNTGGEFIYPDRFQDNLDTYLKYTGQKDAEGIKTSSNTERSGRYHTNWLNMMYPRLKLARNLLRPDGSIFISIDDGEVATLKALCDEIFGSENFISCNIWHKKYAKQNDTQYLSISHDYVLLYARNKETWIPGRLERDKEQLKNYKNPDKDPRGPWQSVVYTCSKSRSERPNLYYSITNPSTGQNVFPDETRVWGCDLEQTKKNIEENRLWWGTDGSLDKPRKKVFLSELKEGVVPDTLWERSIAGDTQTGKREILSMFGKSVFDTPKPRKLIGHGMRIGNLQKDQIILDFFAGSCPTAHAVFDLNTTGQGNIKFIMVQLPEPCVEKSEAFKEGYKTIAEIGKERIRRAAAKIKEENPDNKGDFGFKVFKLDSSNIRAWNPDRTDLEATLMDHKDHLVPGRTEQDVLYELLLKRGVDLTVPIEQKEFSGKTVTSIGYGVLFACLDEAILRTDVEALANGILQWHKELAPDTDTHIFFRDSAFADDVTKTNMAAILEQNGISHVRSL